MMQLYLLLGSRQRRVYPSALEVRNCLRNEGHFRSSLALTSTGSGRHGIPFLIGGSTNMPTYVGIWMTITALYESRGLTNTSSDGYVGK